MTAARRFRKRPVEIEALQYDGANAAEVADWCGGKVKREGPVPVAGNSGVEPGVVIHTLEGDMTASVGDWVIRGIQGEHYPCKPDIFTATYEEV